MHLLTLNGAHAIKARNSRSTEDTGLCEYSGYQPDES